MTHDPLCPWHGSTEFDLVISCDDCDLIAKVREDMLAKCLDAVETSLLNRILDLSYCMKDDDCHIWAEAVEVAYSDSMQSLRELQGDQ